MDPFRLWIPAPLALRYHATCLIFLSHCVNRFILKINKSWQPIKEEAAFTRSTRFSNAQHSFSTPSLSNWIKIERTLSPSLLSLWPPETGTHSHPPSSSRLKIFSCLRPTSTDTFKSFTAHINSSLLPLFSVSPTISKKKKIIELEFELFFSFRAF